VKKASFSISRTFVVSICAILLGFVAGAVLMMTSSSNPLSGFMYLFQGGLKGVSRFCNTLAYAVPLMLTGLSVSFAFQTGLFNIGAPGQMLIGGIFATSLALTLDMPRVVMLAIVISAAIAGGTLWGAIPGLLKAKFNVNEVVSGIMLNWIAYWIVYITISDNFKSATIDTESQAIPGAASLREPFLTRLTGGSNLNLGILIALIATALVVFILAKTVMGYEMKAVGFNSSAAEYGGINVAKNAILAMAISGALSGLAGLTFYMGYSNNMRIGIMPSQGFDGIAVALLANSNPIGVLLSAFFFAILQTGKGFMNAMMPIPPEIADTIIAVIIYFAAASKLIEINMDRIKGFVLRRMGKAKAKKGGQ